MNTHARSIGLGHLANDFYRNCRNEEEKETVPHMLGTCTTLCQRRKKYLGDYYVNEMSRIDIGSFSRFIRSSEWLRY